MYKRGTSTKIGKTLPCGAIVDRVSHRTDTAVYVVCICNCGNEFVTQSGYVEKTKGCKRCISKQQAYRQMKDISGHSFDNGTYVVSFARLDDNGIIWNVYCASCEEIYQDDAGHIMHPDYPMKCKVCTKKKFDITGYKFGKGCVVLGRGPSRHNRHNVGNSRWIYECHCGNIGLLDRWHIINTIQECRECSRATVGKAIEGEKHYNYKPWLTKEDRQYKRAMTGIRRWKREVLKKYDGKCIISDDTDNLHIHHIYNYAERDDLRTEISNGVPLRQDLHTLFHQTYGYKNNDVHQLNEFIINN